MGKIFLLILPFLSFGQNDVQKIKEVLYKQEGAWNQGNLYEFMLGYWKSDKLEFSSENGTTYGWMNTFIKYKKNYPTKEKMGELKFDSLDVKLTSDTTALVNGKWELARAYSPPWGGGFILTFQRFNNDWLIIKDFTTSK